ncbi:MAG: PAS domain-containing protein [Tolypothrix carrinoi HA7290-LM1]|jgi:two-component system CheB/CheR fusion protein|nr:PAS domain-containing protein [Tolypothrix carrinoi HA7290-LM1]
MNNRRSSKKSQSKLDGEQQDNSNVFPIVGIGASAGGLEAFTQLLNYLPSDTGMGFVLVQHLAPDHKSLLKEILSRATQMTVHEVVDNTTVEPNQLYVIPPNKQMTISQGVLKLMPREKIRGLAMTVDTFFLSLAEDQGNKAIAVVLSGGDSDGALGAKAIKAAGGITFAQCQDTAQVSSMPNTAVATGHVDFILPPQVIAQELAKISQHPYIADSASVNLVEEPEPIEGENALQTIFVLLRAATGVDFTYYKHTTLKRRILRRMVLYQIERLQDYVKFLQNHPAEVLALYEDVLINVTSFMRDPEAFEALKSKVFPIITKDKSAAIPIRIWVAGCATGEEAYSIAICLLEFLETQPIKPPIQIYATDISESAIEKARVGIYKHSQMQDLSPERLRRFFVRQDDGYQISKPVRELCVFAKQNLCADPPFSKLDLITCRNVMIYFGATLQKKILPIFHYGLKSTGFLMLGTSETVGEFLDLFSLVDKKYKIYARKLTQARLPIDIVSNNYPLNLGNLNPQVNEETFTDLDLQKQADQIVLNRFAPAGVITNYDLEILQFRGQTSFYLEPAPGRASLNLLKMVREDLRLEIRTAIQQAKKHDLPVKKKDLQIWENQQPRQISINVIPFRARTSEERYFLILFEDAPATSELGETKSEKTTQRKQTTDKEIARLQQELTVTKEHLQAIIEEQEASNQDLRAANEEILSSNEELQSTNEELETAKEEIQAANEELNTLNDELFRRNIESNQVSNDLQNLLSSTNIPIVMLGADLRIRRFTPLAQQILNLIPTDVGRPLGDINLNLNVPDLEQEILDVINNLSPKEQEVQDNKGHWYDLRIRPYRTIDNKIDGAVVILVDIDALKRSATQLAQSRNYAEAIVDTLREPLVVLDTSLQVISANQAFYELFQVQAGQIEQRLRIFELGNGQLNIPQLRSLLEDIVPSNNQLEDFQNLELEYEFEHGRKTLQVNARKMSQAGDRDLILLAIADITQQKQLLRERAQLLSQEQSARAAAETANRIKDEFLSILSHELRNPLNSLVGWAQLLRKQKLDKNKLARGLEAIENSAKLQTQLIEDLLDISRITSGKMPLDARMIQLVPVINAAIEVVRTSADSKQIQIVPRLDASSQQIFGDPIRIQQVVWNLLSNSIKFTPARGRVEITLEYIDSMAEIQVSDTGKGISADFLPYVFDRFRQADSTLTRQNSGLGLGLTIVRHLVEAHGGTVEAESLGEKQGATFTVRLPLQAQIEDAVSPDAIDIEVLVEDIPSIAGVRVLIVDDAADVREIFTAVLQDNQATVTTVATASEAIATLTANPSEYDVLLSDISMPGEDGYTLIRRIRQLSASSGGQIPAAALTAHARDEDRAEALAAGFQMHLTKPVPPNQLALAVATLAGRIRGNGERGGEGEGERGGGGE